MQLSSSFAAVSGGLFSDVTKADVGEATGRLMAAGYDVLAWADLFFPDRALPDSVAAAMLDAIQHGTPEHYTMPIGSPELRAAIAEKLARSNGLLVDPTRNVIVTPGSDSGLFYALMPLLRPGDNVLVPVPSYPNNLVDPQLLGASAVPVPMLVDERGRYHLDISAMKERRTHRTRAVLLTHPNNPTTTVFSRDELEALAKWMCASDLVLVCDQAFEDHVYDGREMVTPASLPGMWDRTITVFSLSKGLGLSGLRVGYVVANDHLMDKYYGAAVNVLGATSTLSQVGALAALQDDSILPRYREALDHRRLSAHRILSQIPGVSVAIPESGILSWLDISALGDTPEVVEHVRDSAHVVINDGTAYGPGGEGHVRIVHSVFADAQHAEAALTRVGDALLQLSPPSVVENHVG